MKVSRVEVEFNDDGTMQVEVRCECGDGMSWDKCRKRYSAKDWAEVQTKVEEAKKEFADMKPAKKGKKDNSVAGFIGSDD